MHGVQHDEGDVVLAAARLAAYSSPRIACLGYRRVHKASRNHHSRFLHGTHGARDAMTRTGSDRRWPQRPVLAAAPRGCGRICPPAPAGGPPAGVGRADHGRAGIDRACVSAAADAGRRGAQRPARASPLPAAPPPPAAPVGRRAAAGGAVPRRPPPAGVVAGLAVAG
ncbi:hypothetical protein BU14_0131s0024 [Porphyra umbilicalis]|uniref:Uncharacterized protein n=1 Tax=Porphyra umbilicalis TaxID=2786 RepID=A0A1X6PAC4_PORUM|nr:hypothetical protein BU14_0131s0024 [Porphyra umbilicalis]|eukprot:OSX77841.1 hypothetical protein BU14_0131s0024 [Porphyra umbilicalis]